MKAFDYLLALANSGGGGGGGTITPITITENGVYTAEKGGYSPVTVDIKPYKSLTYNADNSITLTDLDNVTHTLTPTYDETTGKLISYVFDDKTLLVNYDTDGNLSKVFGIDIEGTENYPQNTKEVLWDDVSRFYISPNGAGVIKAHNSDGKYKIIIPPNVTNLNECLPKEVTSLLTEITLEKTEGAEVTNCSYMCQFIPSGKTVIINFDTSSVTTFQRMFSGIGLGLLVRNIQIIGDIDFSSVTSSNGVYGFFGDWDFDSLHTSHFTLVPNTLKVSLNNYRVNFDDESLVSIANGLIAYTEEGTPPSISFDSRLSDKFTNIVGTVDENMFFTMDENGTVSLEEFVTYSESAIYKNWTLAFI